MKNNDYKNMIELVQIFKWKLGVTLVNIYYRMAYFVLFFV